jgi:hypothetical protein
MPCAPARRAPGLPKKALVTALTALAGLGLTATVGSAAFAGATAKAKPQPKAEPVTGESYQLCTNPAARAKYLTSPWGYHGLSKGSKAYSVAQYEALKGYGTALPPLPPYIAAEAPGAEAAVIFAPGAPVGLPAYYFPESPLLFFFEGGHYKGLALQSVSGDMFIGGSAPGFPEPTFDDLGGAGGINGANDTYGFSGGASTLASPAKKGAATIRTASPVPGYIGFVYFPDGTSYRIASHSGDEISLSGRLSRPEAAGTAVWANRMPAFARVAAAAPQGSPSLTLGASEVPLVPYAHIAVGAGFAEVDGLEVTSVTGAQSHYTLKIPGGLDFPVPKGAPVFYNAPAGDVTVSYLRVTHDLHTTTGTIATGSGWTVTHDEIADSYGAPGQGVAVYGGDEGTVEYNCFSRLGDYAINAFGTGDVFDYNEVYETNYRPDPGCGCSGGGKWWGTLNADIVGNAFVDDSPAGGVPVWLDNGNSGTLIEGNYFYKSFGSAVASETGYNLDISGNLFLDGGWGTGTGGCGSNCDGAVNLNSSGGFDVPGSRYEDEVLVSANQFVDDWSGIDIWQSGARSCENSGEGWPDDAAYCSGGYPNSASPSARGHYYFSHVGDPAHSGGTSLARPVTAGTSTILVQGAEAINDRVGFAPPAMTSTAQKSPVARFHGGGVIRVASTAGFPRAGQLRVGTSAAWADGGGSYTGAILYYRGTTGTSFTGVSLVRGSGALAGPVAAVQPYKVTGEECFQNYCKLSVLPPIHAFIPAGTQVDNSGTCQLYATSAALPRGPLAPDGTSYWDGCQWEVRDVSVTANTFTFSPQAIASGRPLAGRRRSTACTASNRDGCGTNFMAYQDAGEAPFGTQIGANAMMSSPSLSGDLANLNATLRPPGAPPRNGMAPGNDIWSANTYSGPWKWTAYLFGSCWPLPAGMGPDACNVSLSGWRSDWHQG